jgi:glycosyltransferase involved in cell wall biosynthesis
MPRVLNIINRFNLGGPTFNAAYLTKYLSPDYETLLIGGKHTSTEESSDHILNDLKIDFLKIEEMSREVSLINDYRAYKKIKQIIKEFKPDIVHTHASKAGLLGRLAANKMGVRIIVHTFHGHVFHSYFGSIKTNIYKKLEQYLAKKTNTIVAISDKQKKELSDVYKIAKPEKFEIIKLGFDLSKFQEDLENKRKGFREKYKIKNNETVVSIVGRLVPIKNHKLFIDSINQLKLKNNCKIKALIVGGGELFDELNDYTQEIGLTNEDIIFTSWIKETDLVYAGSDIIALTSLNEGTPVSLIEAQSSGKPVISTNVGGVKDITFENSAIIVNQNTDELANAFVKMIENYDIYKKNAEINKSEINENFSYNRLINDYRKLYSKLINETK